MHKSVASAVASASGRRQDVTGPIENTGDIGLGDESKSALAALVAEMGTSEAHTRGLAEKSAGDDLFAAIDAEENVEVRRIMLDRYGWAKFMQDSGAKRIDHDERWGTLYRREIADDEPLVMVEVINRSPEPDGHYRHYSLRVPPTCQAALEAVAWTFDMKPSDYATLGAES